MLESSQSARTHSPAPFDRLLAFLNSDRVEDGSEAEIQEQRIQRYRQIEHKQMRLFIWRGCPPVEVELLVDRTFDRVIGKLDTLESNPVNSPMAFVCGVGRNIYHEWLREQQKKARPPEVEPTGNGDEDDSFSCLDDCIEKLLDQRDREMILEYYAGEKRDKIDHRAELARRFNTTVNAVRIQCCRIRTRLRKCVLECIDAK